MSLVIWTDVLKEKGISAFEDGSISINSNESSTPTSLLRDLSCIKSPSSFNILLNYMLSPKTKDDQRLALGRKLASYSASLIDTSTRHPDEASGAMLLSAALSFFYKKEPPKAIASKISMLEAGNIQRATLLFASDASMRMFIVSFFSYMLAQKRCNAKCSACYSALLDGFKAIAKNQQGRHELFEFVSAQVQLPSNKFTHPFVAEWLKQMQTEQAINFVGQLVLTTVTSPSVHTLQFLLQVPRVHPSCFHLHPLTFTLSP
jgi:hypothetical protein